MHKLDIVKNYKAWVAYVQSIKLEHQGIIFVSDTHEDLKKYNAEIKGSGDLLVLEFKTAEDKLIFALRWSFV